MIQIDPGGGGGQGGGGGTLYDVYQITVNWTYTEPPPTGLLQGFEVICFTGTDPTDTSKYVKAPVPVLSTDRTLVFNYSVAKGGTVPTLNAAVRTVYTWAKGAWVTTGSSSTVTVQSVLHTTTDNLIHNYTSELGNDASLGLWANLVVNDATNSVAGNYVRKLDTSATNTTDLTPFIACLPGDNFNFEAMAKVSGAGPAVKLRLAWFDKSFATCAHPTDDSAAVSATTYGAVPTGIYASAPATACYMKAQVYASTTSAATFGYFDQLLLRRVDGQTMMVAGSQQFTSSGAYSFTVPTGVRRVRVTMTGGGGGGAAGKSGASFGGGGGGAAGTIIEFFDVTPGQVITGTVGSKGNGGATSGTDGADGTDTTLTAGSLSLTAYRGLGGKSTAHSGGDSGGALVRGRSLNSTAGSTGATSNGTEAIFFTHAWAANGSPGGGGGKTGGAGWSTYGLQGFSATGSGTWGGGGGGGSFWGAGGDGGNQPPTAGNVGNAPAAGHYGAGGGAGATDAAAGYAGAAGLDGIVLFEWGPSL